MLHYLVTYQLIEKLHDRHYIKMEIKKEVVEANNARNACSKLHKKYVTDKILIKIYNSIFPIKCFKNNNTTQSNQIFTTQFFAYIQYSRRFYLEW